MVSLNPITDFTTTPITRQTLFDMWSTAPIGQLSEADLAPDVRGIVASQSPPTESPGRMWWNTQSQIMYVYTDVLEDTGVSLWLAIGPDRFECACLTGEPMAAGALADVWYDRWIKVATPSEGVLGDNQYRTIGAVQTGVHYPLNEGTSLTNQSGAWVAVAIDGILTTFTSQASQWSSQQFFGIDADSGHGGIVHSSAVEPPDFDPIFGKTIYGRPSLSANESQPNGVNYLHVQWWGHRNTTSRD